MEPSLNYIRVHGCLVFNVVPELPNWSTVFIVTAAWKQTLLTAWVKKGDFWSSGLSKSLSNLWILFFMVHASFTKLTHKFFPKELLYVNLRAVWQCVFLMK